MKFPVIFMVTLLFTSNSYAVNNFKCVVLDAFILGSDGKLDSENNVPKSKLGKEFIVNRATGQITGGGFVNTMSGQLPKVYDYLPKENGYKVITIYKPNPTVDYLQINEYAESDQKPFLYKGAWGTTVTGLCTYY